MKKIKYLILCGLIMMTYACKDGGKMEDSKIISGCDNGHCEVDFSAKAKQQIKVYEEALENGRFIASDFKQIANMAKNKETFYVVYTFSTCPWCQQLMPILSKLTNELNQDIFYVTVRDENNVDFRNLDNSDYASNYNLVKDLIKDKIYVPALFKFENGIAVKYHEATVEGHNAKEREMTKEEIEKLISQLKDLLK